LKDLVDPNGSILNLLDEAEAVKLFEQLGEINDYLEANVPDFGGLEP
jgi:hypothetical protein